jgi:eukaryotic-like serine/threonine-protein kinase
MELQKGDLFDEFEVLEKIGEGSFSQVYLAHDTVLDRIVVLKQLSAELSTNDSEWNAFVNEAQVTASFFHPGLITVHGLRLDQAANSAMLVLEYMDGGTLRDVLDTRGALDLSQIWNLTFQIGHAVRYLHKRNILHRDIKPENILYSAEMDWFKLTDFGLAYDPSRAEFEVLNQGQPGTLRYMSPEQVTNRPLGTLSDQYTLAAVMYEAMTGTYYLGIDDTLMEDNELIQYILNAYPPEMPMIHHDPVLVEKLEAVLLRALAKHPQERYPTVSRFVREFTRVLEYMESGLAPSGEL